MVREIESAAYMEAYVLHLEELIAEQAGKIDRLTAALGESEARFRVFESIAPMLVWQSDINNHCDFFSLRWLDFTGLRLEQEIGNEWPQGVHPDDLDRCLDIRLAAFDSRKPFSMEYRLRHHSGEYRWIRDNGVPRYDSGKHFCGYIGACVEIDVVKQAQAKAEALSQANDDIVKQLEITNSKLSISDQRLSAMLALSQKMHELEESQLLQMAIDEAVRLTNSEVGYLYFINVDQQTISLGTWSGSKLEQCSAGYENHFPVSEAGDWAEPVRLRRPVIHNNYQNLTDLKGYPEGHFRLCRQIGVPVIEDGQVRLLIGVGNKPTDYDHLDIEQLQLIGNDLWCIVRNYRAERALAEAKRSAEAANFAKSTFLANMSHEIRTPMNSMLGFCYLLQQRTLDCDTRNLVQKIQRSGQLLLDLINDILDFSKIESGKLEVEVTAFSLFEILDDISSLLVSSIGTKKLDLIIVPAIRVDGLFGDKVRIRQVLINLLSNAIKFTEQGQVIFRIDENAIGTNQVELRFSVNDTGIGISPEQQQQIFSPFSQADASISRRFGGSGLGLAISKHLVELMGGELQLRSKVGEGSEFFFALPLKLDDRSNLPTREFDDFHLLFINHCIATCEGAIETAKCLGWHAETVDSIDSALMRLNSGINSTSLYDVLLLDWEQTSLDGLLSAQTFRNKSASSIWESDRPLIILMLGSQAMDDFKSRTGTNELVDAVIFKPITPSNLYRTIQDLRSLRRRRDCSISLNDSAERAVLKRLSGVRILLVDDCEINRDLTEQILAAEGALIQICCDGQEAVDWLLRNPNSIDIVLMDIQMPRLDGYATTRVIRNEIGLSEQLPIIAVTAEAFQSLQNAAEGAGMNDFITKPFDVENLIRRIQHWTGINRSNDLSMAAKPNDFGKPHLIQSEDINYPEPLPDLEWPKGLKKWGDAVKYQNYLNKFSESYSDCGEVIARHSLKSNFSEVATMTHKLKGAAATLALPRVAEISGRLEKTMKTGNPPSKVLVEELKTAIVAACATIKSLPDATKYLIADSPHQSADVDLVGLTRSLNALIAYLDNHDLKAAELLLESLQQQLGALPLRAIKDRLLDFDYSGANQLTRTLMLLLGIMSTE